MRILINIIFLIIIFCAIIFAQSDDYLPLSKRPDALEKAHIHYTAGEKAYKDGDYERAIIEWMNTLDYKPDSAYTKKMLNSAKTKLQKILDKENELKHKAYIKTLRAQQLFIGDSIASNQGVEVSDLQWKLSDPGNLINKTCTYDAYGYITNRNKYPIHQVLVNGVIADRISGNIISYISSAMINLEPDYKIQLPFFKVDSPLSATSRSKTFNTIDAGTVSITPASVTLAMSQDVQNLYRIVITDIQVMKSLPKPIINQQKAK